MKRLWISFWAVIIISFSVLGGPAGVFIKSVLQFPHSVVTNNGDCDTGR